MISTRSDYERYLRDDLTAAGLSRWTFVQRFRRPEVHYLRVLRRVELLLAQPGPVARVRRSWYRAQLMRLSTRLGLTIPPNVFGPGLGIAHYGSIVVHSKAKVGAWCRINSATNIGLSPSGVPTIGDYCYIAPGAVIYGGITIGDRVVIGANAVVGRDVPDEVTVAGAPARVVSQKGSAAMMPDFVPVPRPAQP
ncbi:serine O-acetyltransferase [Microlunatus antarcticus]|uniref:Serine O-acetyltransferase n=1 Tax=Microlunatus antarcticus TaxID=53388 RepID=A0A7W5P847_9ACTN|nr:serine acetyltransferase [Microlunatus antarcticus]MBB3328193.1 serine O-acetyltransferase [Microlunatus antarcticus]